MMTDQVKNIFKTIKNERFAHKNVYINGLVSSFPMNTLVISNHFLRELNNESTSLLWNINNLQRQYFLEKIF